MGLGDESPPGCAYGGPLSSEAGKNVGRWFIEKMKAVNRAPTHTS